MLKLPPEFNQFIGLPLPYVAAKSSLMVGKPASSLPVADAWSPSP